MVRKGQGAYAQNCNGRYCCTTYEDQCPPTYVWVWDDYIWAWRLEKQNSGSNDTKDCQTSASSPCCAIEDSAADTDCVEQPTRNETPAKKKSSVVTSSSYESEEDTEEKSNENSEDVEDFSNQIEYDEFEATESEAESEFTNEESEPQSEEDVSVAAHSNGVLLTKETKSSPSYPKANTSKLAKSSDRLRQKSTSVNYVHQNKDFYKDLDNKSSGKSGILKKAKKKDSQSQSSYDGSSYESSDIYLDSKDASTSTYKSYDSPDGRKNGKPKTAHSSLSALTQKIMESRAAGVDPVAILAPPISMNDQGVGTYRPFVDAELSASEAVQTVDLPDYNLPGSIFFNPNPNAPEAGQVDPSYSFPMQTSKSNNEKGPEREPEPKSSSKYQRFLHSVKSKFKSKK